MLAHFEGAGASVTGRDHVLLGRNNQDAVASWRDSIGIVAVVADGCGSGRSSEIGAGLGARLVMEALRSALPSFDRQPTEAVLADVRRFVLCHLRRLATGLGGAESGAVAESLLFTVLSVAVTAETSVIFGLGDGVFSVNGRTTVLTSDDNAPAYLSHSLRERAEGKELEGRFPFTIHAELPTREVETLVVATDGLSESIETEAIRTLLGDETLLSHPSGLARRLRVLARPTQRIDWAARRVEREPGLFRDDATLFVVRRTRS